MYSSLSAYSVRAFSSSKDGFRCRTISRPLSKGDSGLHGIPMLIVSDRDTKFVCKFWQGFQFALGIELCTSTAFHPQTDG